MNWLRARTWEIYSRRLALRSFFPPNRWLTAARLMSALTNLSLIAWLTSVIWLDRAAGLLLIGFTTLGLLIPALGLNLVAAITGLPAYRRYFVLIPGTLLATVAAGLSVVALWTGPEPSKPLICLAVVLCLYASQCWLVAISDDLPGVEAGIMRF